MWIFNFTDNLRTFIIRLKNYVHSQANDNNLKGLFFRNFKFVLYVCFLLTVCLSVISIYLFNNIAITYISLFIFILLYFLSCVFTNFLNSAISFFIHSIFICFFIQLLVLSILSNVVVDSFQKYLLVCLTFFVVWSFLSLIVDNNVSTLVNEILSICFGVLLLIKDVIFDCLPNDFVIDLSTISNQNGFISKYSIVTDLNLFFTPCLIINSTTMILCLIKGHLNKSKLHTEAQK